MTSENFVSKMFLFIAVATKYIGVVGIGMALSCLFVYGFEAFVFVYIGLSILIVILSLVATRQMRVDPEYYDDADYDYYE